MNKRKPCIFTTEIMENTIFFGENTDFDGWRLAALHVATKERKK